MKSADLFSAFASGVFLAGVARVLSQSPEQLKLKRILLELETEREELEHALKVLDELTQ